MICAICGTSGASRVATKGTLCQPCAASTPRKVSRVRFDLVYWGRKYAEVPEGTRRDFYRDYRASSSTLKDYIDTTTHNIFDLC